MKITPFWASVALLRVVPVLAATTPSPTSTSSAPTCTASLIASLCNYPEPGPDFAVAEDSRASCWNYCNAHPPCSFVIFAEGNPYTGTGTCWLYPGESYDASAGSSNCADSKPYLFVYSQPVCKGGKGSPTSDSCAATATPSAIASVCGYPTPDDDCFSSCSASYGATDCLSQCAKADSCSYVVFNPHNDDNSPYAPGSCWMYPNGTYDASAASTCKGAPEQYVYKNPCPKPSHSSSSAPAKSTGTTSTASGTLGTETGSAVIDAEAATTSESSASTVLTSPLAIFMYVAVLLW
ncbi:hypothetical protein CFAM422_012414 [Trichoderma lentiforme]|uniref:Uncharacterized protein n=1 Tax=Trichoderma lentiforme TaxID=1567552 RepID=A0A9P4X4U0_9HYPO|nr:hypothetical protein CFAM422_012414 [Trichoderma lentiforme]